MRLGRKLSEGFAVDHEADAAVPAPAEVGTDATVPVSAEVESVDTAGTAPQPTG